MNNDSHQRKPEPAAAAANTAQPTGSAGMNGHRFAVTAAAGLRIAEAESETRFAELKAELPPRAARRMSRLGLMLSHLIGKVGIDEETVVIYASMFGEGRTLETYLASFPQPSPLGFQSSIHPGAIEQALILRQQPVREFFPITASENLPLALFRTLEQCRNAKRILLLGGEESASWLTQYKLAAADNLAFALLLESACAAQPIGWLTNDTAHSAKQNEAALNEASAASTSLTGQPVPNGETLTDLCAVIETREPMRFAHPDEGSWLLHWKH